MENRKQGCGVLHSKRCSHDPQSLRLSPTGERTTRYPPSVVACGGTPHPQRPSGCSRGLVSTRLSPAKERPPKDPVTSCRPWRNAPQPASDSKDRPVIARQGTVVARQGTVVARQGTLSPARERLSPARERYRPPGNVVAREGTLTLVTSVYDKGYDAL